MCSSVTTSSSSVQSLIRRASNRDTASLNSGYATHATRGTERNCRWHGCRIFAIRRALATSSCPTATRRMLTWAVQFRRTVQGQQYELAYSTSRRSDSSLLSYYSQKANRCNAKGDGPSTAAVQIMASLGRYTLVINIYLPLSLLMQSDTRAALLASTGSGAG